MTVSASRINTAQSKAVGGKKDRCRKGKSCSATCISSWKQCLVEMSSNATSSLEKLSGRLKSSVAQIKRQPERLFNRRKFDQAAAERYLRVRNRLRGKLRKLAELGNKGAYDKLERKIIKIEGRLLAKVDTKKGQVWAESADVRMENRRRNYFRAKYALKEEMRKRARLLDNAGYEKYEKALLKLQERSGGKLGDRTKLEKGQLWKQTRDTEVKLRATLGNLKQDMTDAAKVGNKNMYDKAESRLLRILDKVGKKFDLEFMGVKKGEVWGRFKDTTPHKIGVALGDTKNPVTIYATKRTINLISKPGGNKLEIILNSDAVSFRVNDRYLMDPNLSKKEKFAIVRALKDQFPRVFSALPEGSAYIVSAIRGDGREEARREAYRDAGFSDPVLGSQFGRIRNGKMTPATRDEYFDHGLESFS